MLNNEELLNNNDIINNICIFYQSTDILVLDNVLLKDECDKLKSLQNDFGKSSIKDLSLSDKIELRCNKYIRDLIYEYDDKSCVIRTDKAHYWVKDKINSSWGLYKCKLGRSISSHFDRVTIKSVDNKSMFTIIVYLETSDGNLKFKEIEIEPIIGRIVIFKQNLIHEGLENKNNIKYYLHSSILYKRSRIIESDNDKIALDIFNKSKQLYKQKLYDEAEKLQEEAFKLSPLLERSVLSLF